MAKSQPIDSVTRDLNKLSNDDLLLVRRLIDGLLEAREAQRAKARSGAAVDIPGENPTREPLPSGAASELANKRRGRGYYEKKIINGCGPYLYLRYRDGKIHRSVYLGKANIDND